MDSLPLEDQLQLHELLALYNSLTKEIETDGLKKYNAQKLYDVYNAMSKLLVMLERRCPG